MADLFFDAMFALLGSFSPGRHRFDAEQLARIPLWLITLGVGTCWIALGGPVVYMLAIAPGPFRFWLLVALGPGLVALTGAFVFSVLAQMRSVDEDYGRHLAVRLCIGGLAALAVGMGVLVVLGVFAFLNMFMNIG